MKGINDEMTHLPMGLKKWTGQLVKFEYLKNRLTVLDDFWYDDNTPLKEYNDGVDKPLISHWSIITSPDM